MGPGPGGSDHFSIILENKGPPSLETFQKWRLTMTNGEQFQHRLHQSEMTDADYPVSLCASMLKETTDATITL